MLKSYNNFLKIQICSVHTIYITTESPQMSSLLVLERNSLNIFYDSICYVLLKEDTKDLVSTDYQYK